MIQKLQFLRFAYFAMLLPEFSSLPRPDQGMLLRAGILEMCLLRSALCFDIQVKSPTLTTNLNGHFW